MSKSFNFSHPLFMINYSTPRNKELLRNISTRRLHQFAGDSDESCVPSLLSWGLSIRDHRLCEWEADFFSSLASQIVKCCIYWCLYLTLESWVNFIFQRPWNLSVNGSTALGNVFLFIDCTDLVVVVIQWSYFFLLESLLQVIEMRLFYRETSRHSHRETIWWDKEKRKKHPEIAGRQ